MPNLRERRWPELDRPVLLVPLGSCEQHGPHLPLGTDAIIAERLARSVAAETDASQILVTPPIAIAASGEHAGFPGTLSIGTSTTAGVLVELIRSADWATGVVIVNGHGGNVAAMNEALTVSHHDGRTNTAAWTPRAPEGLSTDLHAGFVETSVMLHLAPELVRLGLAAPGPRPSIAELVEHGVAELSPSGVLGDPTGASAGVGEEVFAGWSASLRSDVQRHRERWEA